MEKKYIAKDYSKYKTEIALPDFLIDNYKFLPTRDSSFCSPKLKSQLTGQTIVIRMNSLGYYTYFDVHNDNIKGATILDFLKEEMSVNGKAPSLYAIADVLDNYIKSGKVLSPDRSKYYMSKCDWDINLLMKEIRPLSDRTFLHGRGISDQTIDSDIFREIFSEREFIKDGVIYLNTITKLFNSKGVSGVSQRNDHFKGCLMSRADSLAISNFDKNRPIDIYFLAESMIDCASHYQLNQTKLNGLNVVYFSSEGSLSMGQIKLFQQSLNFMNPENIISLCDRDIPGQEYNLKLFGNLVLNGRGDEIQTEVIRDLNEKNIILNLCMPESVLTKKMNEFGKAFFTDNIIGPVELQINKMKRSDLMNMKICFPRTYNNVDQFVIKLREFRLGKCNLLRQVPLTNDFNDDLRAKLGIHKEWKLENHDGREVGVPIIEKKNEQGRDFM